MLDQFINQQQLSFGLSWLFSASAPQLQLKVHVVSVTLSNLLTEVVSRQRQGRPLSENVLELFKKRQNVMRWS